MIDNFFSTLGGQNTTSIESILESDQASSELANELLEILRQAVETRVRHQPNLCKNCVVRYWLFVETWLDFELVLQHLCDQKVFNAPQEIGAIWSKGWFPVVHRSRMSGSCPSGCSFLWRPRLSSHCSPGQRGTPSWRAPWPHQCSFSGMITHSLRFPHQNKHVLSREVASKQILDGPDR